MKLRVVFLLMLVLFLAGCSGLPKEFAQCLTDNDVKMYGAFWCPHCQDQKALFGKSSFKEINYIECSKPDRSQTKFCDDKDIEGYPTWEFANGTREGGFVTAERLSELSGCPLEV